MQDADRRPWGAPVNAPSPDEFLDLATPLLDWSSLSAWIAAIEARVGMPVSIALYKMILLERWFQLSGAELDDACHGRAAFRRFLGAPLHGPVAEVWMHRQFAPKLASANLELGKLITAVELMLTDRGLSPPSSAWTGAETAQVTLPNEGIRTTVLEPGRLSAIAADAESAGRAARFGPGPNDAGAGPIRRIQATAVLIWPWAATTPVDRTLKIGRDPEFSPFARQLWADPRISRRHAELVPDEDGIVLRDLGSSNGTYIGDVPLPANSSTVVYDDVQLRFGTNLAVKLVFLPPKPTDPA